MWDRRARVVAVKDGDTLRVVLDQGFGDTKELDLRLYDTWAPEKRQVGGPETRAFVEGWLVSRASGPWPFIVTTRRTSTDHEVETLGRYVGILTTPAGESLNDAVNAYVAASNYPKGIGAPSGAPSV